MQQHHFGFVRVARTMVPASALLLLLGFAWSYGWLTPATFWRPALEPVRGIVLLNGSPLPGATVDTHSGRSGVRGATGVTDERGHFTLRTLADNGFRDGAAVGRHLVTVTVSEPRPGGFGNRLLTPEKYASAGGTPLVLSVTRSNGKLAPVVLALEGELLPSGGPAEAGVEPAEGFFVTPILLHYDVDGDDRLSKPERRQIDTAARRGIDLEAIDFDRDGYVDREELTRAAVVAMQTPQRADLIPLIWETHLPAGGGH